ncbi:MAG: aspartate/glutamate racemase family protein [Lachnospiraceae bacterium]|jgi:aspartate racemase|nr:aspartate/glutamate racemase family protein [Lachnospiraceae bacterium]
MKRLGIIGGLGPMATAYFLQLLTQMSDAETDQEHMEIRMISNPATPDRTKFILGESTDSPLPQMAEAGRTLKDMGAQLLAIPCITAHYFHGELEERTGLKVLNAVEETACYLREREIRSAGIMATDGTIKSGLFQRALERKGIESVIPDKASQRKLMDIIYLDIKAGKTPDAGGFAETAENLRSRGSSVILLACTELSLIKKERLTGAGYLDVMEVLAAKAVEECGSLRPKYRELIT